MITTTTMSRTRIRGWSFRSGWPLDEGTSIFGLSLALNLVMCLVVVYWFNLFVTDSMSRTVSAWRVFYGADPKLSEVGFIWAPLPTLLQLPFVLISPLRDAGLAGNVVTAIMGAVTVASLNRIFRLFALGRWLRYGLLILFSLNPMILYYSANGLSEMTFVAITVLSLSYLIQWQQTRSIQALILLGFSVGAALLARYDTAVHAVLLLPILYLFLKERPTQRDEAQALLVTYFAPVCFCGGLWVLFNLMIMGDPIYFVRGAYSNAAQIGYQLALLGEIAKLTGDPIAIARFIGEQVTLLFPMFSIGLALLFGHFLRARNRLSLALALLAMSFPAFQALNFFTGQSAAFIRYFILAIPYGYLMAAFLLSRSPGLRLRQAAVGAAAVGLLVSNVATAHAMSTVWSRTSDWGQWNDGFVQALVTGKRLHTWAEDRDIASFLTKHARGRETLVDAFQGYRIIFFNGDPAKFVVNGDRDFDDLLQNPFGTVRFLLVASPELEGALNRVNQRYPTLYEQGAPWARLVGEWPVTRWKLYEIVRPTD
ncbi:MAG: glycosyltransferase family 39 protein [Chloroflexi bacterium]|nr:glycosyltransferase family 39 protein [Chloroflexota bacterium]